MTAKQQIATGFLATLIICSVAFMPATADSGPQAAKPVPRHASPVVATQAGAAQQANPPGRDLTYN